MTKKVKNDGTYSIKRRLSIAEKVIIIYLALFSFPLGLSFSTFFIKEINPLDGQVVLSMLPAWIVVSFAIIGVEFAIKNVCLYKGIVKSTVFSTLIAFCIVFAVLCIYYLNGTYPLIYVTFAIFIAGFYILFLTIFRIFVYFLNSNNKKIALIFGPKEDVLSLARKLIRENRKQYRVKYLFFEEDFKEELLQEKFKRCNTIILLNTLTFKNKQKYLLYFNSTINKDVYLCTTYFDVVLLGNNTKNINDLLSFEQKPLRIDVVESVIKRLIDILASSLILILSIPVWLVVPLIIKLQDGGPVFYKQVRLTIHMKEFKILKFRSMRVDAEKNGAQLSTSNDQRVTKFGKFIRATRIDEIPQVINVFKGDMSLVGPRPERPEFVKGFLEENDLYKYRYNVKAGVTGLQQVSTTYHTTYDDKLRYDLYYISNYTTILDIEILFMTIKTVLSKSMAEGVDNSNLSFNDFLIEEEVEFEDYKGYYHLRYNKKKA